MIPGSANPLLLKSAAAAGGYQVSRSLRFNSSDSAYLSRTPAVAGDRRTWTWAGWVKRGALSTDQMIFTSRPTSSPYALFYFTSADYLQFSDNTFGYIRTASVFRDPSAWYHIVLAVDTTGATAADYLKIYVNNVRQTIGLSSLPTLNSQGQINTATAHSIGSPQPYANNEYFDGYLADIHFIDGQALTPSSFTEVSATTGQLIPKTYSGSYGTNGFQLKFADNSSNTATTLGKDTSGNSNNWTPNNLSVTAGAGNDSLVDTPTSGLQVDTGLGGQVTGNYATWNPLISSTNLTNGNLSVVQPSTTAASRYSTIGMSTGKWYWEISVVKYSNTVFGIRTPGGGTLETPYDPSGYGMGWRTSGGFFIGGSNTGTGSMSLAAGDVLGLAFDADAGTLRFYKNGTLNNTLTASSTYIGQTWFAGSQDSSGGNSDHDVNFGQRAWAYTAPTNYRPLVDTLLPAPVVAKPNTLMDVVLYTGTGSALTPTSSLGFNPDWIWIKSRSAATDHALYDVVRGAQVRLESNNGDVEVTSDNGVTAFNSAGFTLGTLAQVNTSSATYVAWCWDAGTSTVSNTAGSITSQVRANVSAGFSVVSWTSDGTGSIKTCGHGLGVKPSLIIFKNRDLADQWGVLHSSFADQTKNWMRLNTTEAVLSSGAFTYFSYDSTTFGIKENEFFLNTNRAIAYCFAPVVGYGNGLSYVGNGSADGPFVYLGFRPKLILIKCSSTTGNWVLLDAEREGYNVDNDPLFPNLSDAEGTTDLLDITSNGFKIRSTNADVNASAATYIVYAWASNPFQYSRAR